MQPASLIPDFAVEQIAQRFTQIYLRGISFFLVADLGKSRRCTPGKWVVSSLQIILFQRHRVEAKEREREKYLTRSRVFKHAYFNDTQSPPPARHEYRLHSRHFSLSLSLSFPYECHASHFCIITAVVIPLPPRFPRDPSRGEPFPSSNSSPSPLNDTCLPPCA